MKNSAVTELSYTTRLKQYCDNVGKNPDELIAFKLEGLQNPATEKEFQAEEMLEKFLRQDTYFRINEDGTKKERPFKDNAKLGMLIAIKSFYDSTRGRSLAPDVGEFIEVPEPKKRSPTVQDCLELENAMKCNRDKFLLWFLESCPVRKGTLKQLKFGDLKPLNDKDVPYWLRIEAKRLKGQGKGKYRKAKHVGFLHYYAVQKFEAYKEELKYKGIPFNDDSPLFMSYKSTAFGSRKGLAQVEFFVIFRDASEIAWRDLNKKRFSPHDLRDVLSTVLLNPKVKANTNLTKPLTSHVPTGIEATYENPQDSEDKPNNDQLEVFKLCIPFLVPETVPELKTELNEQKVMNQKQVDAINYLNMEIEDSKRSLKKNEFEMRKSEDEFKRKLEQMQKQIEFLMLSSEVDPEKVNRLHALEEDKRDQAYAEAQEENEREIPVSELTKEEQAEFDRRVKECKKSQKGSNSAS